MMAGRVIKRARTSLLEHPFSVNDHPIEVTASFGVATFHGYGLESYETLIERADRGLYLAKERGNSLIVSCEVGNKEIEEKNSYIP
jgi:diguanylate cyclase (GGDEF)-like protein